jgi:hypothetical protein
MRGVGTAVVCGVEVACGVGGATLGAALSEASEPPAVGNTLWSEESAISPIGLSVGRGCVAVARTKTAELPRPAKTRAITNMMPTKPLF